MSLLLFVCLLLVSHAATDIVYGDLVVSYDPECATRDFVVTNPDSRLCYKLDSFTNGSTYLLFAFPLSSHCATSVSVYVDWCGGALLEELCSPSCHPSVFPSNNGSIYLSYIAPQRNVTDTVYVNAPVLPIVLGVVLPTLVVAVLAVLCAVYVYKRKASSLVEELTKRIRLQSNHIIDVGDLLIHHNKTLGNGAFGEVKLGTLRRTTTVAVKEAKVHDDNGGTNALLGEAEIITALPSHPNLVQFLGLCINRVDDTFYIVTQYVANKSLQSYFRNLWEIDPTLDLSVEDKALILMGVAAGMDHLSRYRIVHNDLAARNILLERSVMMDGQGKDTVVLVPKLTDFGLSVAKSKKRSDGASLPLRWTAPEVIMDPSACSSKSDVWSFGVVVYEVMDSCFSIPYRGMNNSEVKKAVVTDRYVLPKLACFPDSLHDVMVSCLNYLPELRPDFQQLHQVLREVAENPCHITVQAREPETFTDGSIDAALEREIYMRHGVTVPFYENT